MSSSQMWWTWGVPQKGWARSMECLIFVPILLKKTVVNYAIPKWEKFSL